MTLHLLIFVVGLLALLFTIAAFRSFRRRRLVGGALHGAASLALLSIAIGTALIAVNLRTYQRMNDEQRAGELKFTRIGDHQFNGALTLQSGEREDFALRGDEWQIDAHVLKWRLIAVIIGFDTAYRLDRISGRYTDIHDERTQARTVYALSPAERVNIWSLARRYHTWLPGVDALYGSATFLPMADGALYEIKVSESGLLARPLNEAARAAVGNWR